MQDRDDLICKAKLRLKRYFETLTLVFVQFLILFAFEPMLLLVMSLELWFPCPVSLTMP